MAVYEPFRNRYLPSVPRLISKIHVDELFPYFPSYLARAAPNPRPTARQKLTKLTIQQFHELSTDVYDELVRRKNENEVPFLPIRENFHPKRNQARQKLATLSPSRFEDLLSDVYFELTRRYPEFKEAVQTSEGGYAPSIMSSVSRPEPSQDTTRQIDDGEREYSSLPAAANVISTNDYPNPMTPATLPVGLNGLSARLMGVDDDGAMPGTENRSEDDYLHRDNSLVPGSSGSRGLAGHAGVTDSHEKMRRDYEYKVATMLSQITNLHPDPGGTGEGERRMRGSGMRVTEDGLAGFQQRTEEQSPAMRSLQKELDDHREQCSREKTRETKRAREGKEELYILRDRSEKLEEQKANRQSQPVILDYIQVNEPDISICLPYQETLMLLNNATPKPHHNATTRSIRQVLESCAQDASDPDPVNRLRVCHHIRKQLLLVSELLSLSDARLRSALREDEHHVGTLLREVLTSDSHKHAALGLKGESAQQLLDSILSILDKSSVQHVSDHLGLQARQLIVKLSMTAALLPSTLFIDGIDDVATTASFGGSFGDIFRASYKGADVALKRIRTFQGDIRHSDIYQTLCREALVWQQLKHPNVLPFLGVDSESFPPSVCLVSPWMKHGTILKYLKDNGRSRLHTLLIEIAEGLNYLHLRNVVHGDLRGGNILVDDEWHARLADFGLTVFNDGTMGSQTATQRGSLRWMAPELLDPDAFGLPSFQRTPASDVYSFACVVLELCTGHHPFVETIPDGGVLLKLLKGDRPNRPTGLSDTMWRMVQTCWSQDYKQRPGMPTVIMELNKLNGTVIHS